MLPLWLVQRKGFQKEGFEKWQKSEKIFLQLFDPL